MSLSCPCTLFFDYLSLIYLLAQGSDTSVLSDCPGGVSFPHGPHFPMTCAALTSLSTYSDILLSNVGSPVTLARV